MFTRKPGSSGYPDTDLRSVLFTTPLFFLNEHFLLSSAIAVPKTGFSTCKALSSFFLQNKKLKLGWRSIGQVASQVFFLRKKALYPFAFYFDCHSLY